MVKLFEIIDSSEDHISFKADNFADTNLQCFTVYDTPVQYQLSTLTSCGTNITTPDYYVWRSTTKTSTGLDYNWLPVTTENLFSVKRNKPDINYDNLYDTNFHIVTIPEFECLRQLTLQLDMVHKRYPHKFEKKFTVEEMLVFIEAALIDVNITPPQTRFWWMFKPKPDYQTQVNQMAQTQFQQWEVPTAFRTMIVMGALIHALIARGLLEIDVNFTYNDQGISLTYDNVTGYQSWYNALLTQYTEQKKITKMNYLPKGKGIGSIPDFGLGWFGLVNSALDNRYNQSFYPWFLAWGGGRPQI